MLKLCRKLWRHRTRLWRRYIWRRSPYALYSWRYIMPTDNHAVRCQRYFSLRVLPELPRVAALLVVLHQLLWWYLWHAPKAIWRVWRAESKQLVADNQIARWQQCFSLIRLAYGRAIQPAAYYALALYRYPHSDNFYFIYSQQLPDWHKVWQQSLPADVQAVIQNKHLFAEFMAQAGLCTVPSLGLWQQGTHLDELRQFEHIPVFCKPVASSRAQGCFSLEITPFNSTLCTFNHSIRQQDGILAYINQQLARQSYLVQPLLRHHTALDQFMPEGAASADAITVRLVSAYVDGAVLLLAANLEVNTTQQRLNLLPIAPLTGRLYQDNLQLPLWPQLLAQVQAGHCALAQVKTLGWDFIIGQHQVYCLEVNFNWNVQVMQRAEQGGLLCKTDKVYLC